MKESSTRENGRMLPGAKRKERKMFLPLVLGAAAILFVSVWGCTSTKPERSSESDGGGVQAVALDRPPQKTDIEPQDIRRMVERMVESLLADSRIVDYARGECPVLDIEPIQNKTKTELDMTSISDSMRTMLIRSRRFRFVDRSTAKKDIAIFDEQARLLPGDSTKAVRSGQRLAAQMYLTGTLTDMVNSIWKVSSPLKKLTDHYYKLSMWLKDSRTDEIIWSDEQEIRKMGNLPFWR